MLDLVPHESLSAAMLHPLVPNSRRVNDPLCAMYNELMVRSCIHILPVWSTGFGRGWCHLDISRHVCLPWPFIFTRVTIKFLSRLGNRYV